VQPGEEATEDGFLCDHSPVDLKMPMPASEIGTPDEKDRQGNQSEIVRMFAVKVRR
jgi:hypothetical protein